MLLVFLGLVIVLVYTEIIVFKTKEIPPSISETFYLGGKHWFTVVLFVSSILITMGMLDLTEGSDFQFVSFLTGAGMAFVGASPHFHDTEKTVHCIGAIFLLAGSQIWLGIFVTPYIYATWLLSVFWFKRESRVFWCEITAIVTMLIGLLIIGVREGILN